MAKELAQEPLVECVPNFSEGRNSKIINAIANAMEAIPRVRLLNIDPGYDTHRTVMTLVGSPADLLEAIYRGIEVASNQIDMRQHRGIHPRFGSTDVCPFIPLRNITSDHCIALAKQLGKRVGDELKIPVYLYELAATTIDRKNLANVRKGEYEGLAEKMLDPQWQPDFGPHEFNAKNGAIAIGARPLLIAYNVNIAGESLEAAKIIAGTIRESGRRDPISGNQLAGKFKSVKAKAWYLAQYQRTQVTMNLSDYRQTSMHAVYETISELAASEKITVTGSQLVGMAPKEALIQSGIYYWKRKNPHLSDNSALEIPTEALIQYAVTALGLEEFGKFHFNEKVLDQSRL